MLVVKASHIAFILEYFWKPPTLYAGVAQVAAAALTHKTIMLSNRCEGHLEI